MPNARVFPEPAFAWPMRFLLSRRGPMAWACMGNGLTYPDAATPFFMAGLRGNDSKPLSCGHPRTDVLTL